MAALPPANASTPEPPHAPPAPKKVEITFQDGRLRLVSNKASLAEVLNEIRAQLNADIVVPAGAEQEMVAVALGPSTPRDVISKLLDGSRYNFIIVGTDADANQVERVVLSPKTVIAESAIAPPTPVVDTEGGDRSVGAPPPIPPPPPTEDVQPQGDSNPPPDTTPQPGDPQPAPN
jgi:type II secretory pathway component GspD/PulD (secretin)